MTYHFRQIDNTAVLSHLTEQQKLERSARWNEFRRESIAAANQATTDGIDLPSYVEPPIAPPIWFENSDTGTPAIQQLEDVSRADLFGVSPKYVPGETVPLEQITQETDHLGRPLKKKRPVDLTPEDHFKLEANDRARQQRDQQLTDKINSIKDRLTAIAKNKDK